MMVRVGRTENERERHGVGIRARECTIKKIGYDRIRN